MEQEYLERKEMRQHVTNQNWLQKEGIAQIQRILSQGRPAGIVWVDMELSLIRSHPMRHIQLEKGLVNAWQILHVTATGLHEIEEIRIGNSIGFRLVFTVKPNIRTVGMASRKPFFHNSLFINFSFCNKDYLNAVWPRKDVVKLLSSRSLSITMQPRQEVIYPVVGEHHRDKADDGKPGNSVSSPPSCKFGM